MALIFRAVKVFLRLLDAFFLALRKKLSQNNGAEQFIDLQNRVFQKIGLDREAGVFTKDEVLKNMASSGFIRSDYPSEHEVLFASIAHSKGERVKSILEVGTFEGHTTAYLSIIFPHAQIVTMDLPLGDTDFNETYGKGGRGKRIGELRDNNINTASNILFREENSLQLVRDENEYDLIWLDGNHGHPVVVIDIVNALNLLSMDGMLVIDDVYQGLHPWQIDEHFTSNASLNTLEKLSEEGLIKFEMLLKRLGDSNNVHRRFTKHIAVVTKLS